MSDKDKVAILMSREDAEIIKGSRLSRICVGITRRLREAAKVALEKEAQAPPEQEGCTEDEMQAQGLKYICTWCARWLKRGEWCHCYEQATQAGPDCDGVSFCGCPHLMANCCPDASPPQDKREETEVVWATEAESSLNATDTMTLRCLFDEHKFVDAFSHAPRKLLFQALVYRRGETVGVMYVCWPKKAAGGGIRNRGKYFGALGTDWHPQFVRPSDTFRTPGDMHKHFLDMVAAVRQKADEFPQRFKVKDE